MRKGLLGAYRSDASRLKGEVREVLHPESVEEVCKMVAGNEKIVIRGAGTGLAGGAVPKGDVVLDLSKLTGISDFDEARKTVVVEAGVILDDLQEFLKPYNLEFPVKPSSHAVATIGGMIATDAVGHRSLKYGKTSANVRWIEVVDSAGRLDRKGQTEISDYSGMEGITGVIVRACLNLLSVKERSASLIRVESLEGVAELVRQMKRRDNVCGLEFFDKVVSRGIGFVKEEDKDSYHVLVEYEGDDGGLKGEAYEKVMKMRDGVYPFLAGEGYTRIEDPKVFLDKFAELVKWLEVNGIPSFGHVGEGIIHPCFNVDQERLIPEMMKLVGRGGGRVSGEHGIGLLKRGFVEINDQKILRNVKRRTDPLGKFNQGKVI